MVDDPFPENLGYACSLFSSIADVCRRVGINRQQFNKYLAGSVRPSRHNMHRICDFFGMTEGEFLMEPARFSELISLRRAPNAGTETAIVGPILKRLSQGSAPLDRYCGAYFRYFYSFSNPGLIIRSFARLSRRDGQYVWKNIERFATGPRAAAEVKKYAGLAFYLGERINVVEYESVLASSITHMNLYPSYHSGIHHLLGVQTGGSLKRGRRPAASRVLLDYLGLHVHTKRALRQCGLFAPERIDQKIASLVLNEMTPGASVFDIEQL